MAGTTETSFEMSDFDALQSKLVSMWPQIGAGLTDHTVGQHTVVVVPSIAYEDEFTVSALKAFEERMLYMLLLLRDPDIRVIFITSEPVHHEIIDYYLELIPGVISSHARKRLVLVAPEDGSQDAPLTRKLLNRPHLLRHIKASIPDTNSAHLVPFVATDDERELAIALDIPMYAADPRFYGFGTKTGCRRLFSEEGVEHPLGIEDLWSLDAVVEAIITMNTRRPLKQVVLKLNEGVSGLGNMLLTLGPGGTPVEAEALRNRIVDRGRELDAENGGSYVGRIATEGAIVEEFVSGQEVRSPSAQIRVTPLGDVQILSTHDQMLGGDDGQSYLGALFPADLAYSRTISRDAERIGKRLAKEGVLGRFAVDFLAVRNGGGEWQTYAIEINLRKGGTTAPYRILQYLTDGHYDPESGVFLTAEKLERYYVASDHVESEHYRQFNTTQLLDVSSARGLHYDHATETGVVLHMMSDVGEAGRVGITAIGRSPAEAMELHDRFAAVLIEETERLSQI